jgi:hypothetical protein
MADFDEAYSQAPTSVPAREYNAPVCNPANGCFPASHVTPQGDFLINTYLTRPDKMAAAAGAIPVREGALCKSLKN